MLGVCRRSLLVMPNTPTAQGCRPERIKAQRRTGCRLRGLDNQALTGDRRHSDPRPPDENRYDVATPRNPSLNTGLWDGVRRPHDGSILIEPREWLARSSAVRRIHA